MSEILDVVNRNDEVIGQAERDVVHAEGLICRMVYVWFVTPDKKIILQRRSLTKKSAPGKLITTVSGHVESGSTYLLTAVKETFEETGVRVKPEDLVDVGVNYASYPHGAYLSNGMRASYIYHFNGDLKTLKIEEGEGVGFELWKTEDVLNAVKTNPEQFAAFMADTPSITIIKKIQNS